MIWQYDIRRGRARFAGQPTKDRTRLSRCAVYDGERKLDGVVAMNPDRALVLVRDQGRMQIHHEGEAGCTCDLDLVVPIGDDSHAVCEVVTGDLHIEVSP